MPRFSISPRRFLTICTLLALFFAFLPGKYSGWIDALQGPVDFFFAPISHTAAFISRSFRPAVSETLPSDPDLARLAIERDELQTRVLDDDRRIADLERLVRDLQGGLALAPDASVKAMSASVIGSSSDLSDGLLTIRAGKDQGVTERDSIAVVNGVHLVGRVESAAGRTCRVRPVTRSKAGYIQALVYAEGGKSWRCQLRGTDSGTLTGDLVVGSVGIEPGQIVRLQDPDWPEAAQMLVLGRVESVGQTENFPLRSVVTVRPDIQLERVRRIVLRMPAESAGGRWRAAMNWLVYGVVAWVMFGLELGLKDALQLGATGIAPSFVVVLLVVIAVSAPRQTALWAALAPGVLLDLTHKSPAPVGIRPVIVLGPYTLGCLLAAYTVLTTRAMVFRRNVITIAFLSLLASAMMHIVVTAIFAVRQWYDGDSVQINALVELRNGLADALYTAVLAMLVAPGLLFLSPLLGFPQAQGRDRGRRR